nr:TM2 domain-containing protein [Corynebacterium uropygiale]
MPQPGVQQHYPVVSQQGGLQPVSAAGKNKVLAAVFALFLGQFGIHNFYLGNRERGIGQLVLFGATFVPIIHLVSVPVLVVWVTVEFILILLDVGSYNTKGPS